MEKVALHTTTNLAEWMQQKKLPKDQVNIIGEMIHHYYQQFNSNLQYGEENVLYGMYEVMDQFDRDIPDKVRREISCKKGCSFCCHINVDVTEVEVKLIQKYAEERKMEINYEAAADPNRSACPFLSVNGKCSVYKVRPLACRKYFVISDPKLCDSKKYGPKIVTTYVNIEMEALTSGIHNAKLKFAPLRQVLLKLKPCSTSTEAIK
jgi:Fe-S-cluster containining protein